MTKLMSNFIAATLATFIFLQVALSKLLRVEAAYRAYFLGIELILLLGLTIIAQAKGQSRVKVITDPIFWILGFYTGLMVILAFANNIPVMNNFRIMTWAPAPLLYFLACKLDESTITKGIIAAMPSVLLWQMPDENDNIVAMSLIASAIWLGRNRTGWLVLLLAASVFYAYLALESQSVLFAAILAIGMLLYRRFPRLVLGGGLAYATFLLFVRSHALRFFQARDDLFRIALNDFKSSPIFGVGPHTVFKFEGMSHPHAHNIFMTTASEMGLIGIALLFLLGVAVFKRWDRYDLWNKFFILLFASWSLVDDPMQWALINSLWVITLSTAHWSRHEFTSNAMANGESAKKS